MALMSSSESQANLGNELAQLNCYGFGKEVFCFYSSSVTSDSALLVSVEIITDYSSMTVDCSSTTISIKILKGVLKSKFNREKYVLLYYVTVYFINFI